MVNVFVSECTYFYNLQSTKPKLTEMQMRSLQCLKLLNHLKRYKLIEAYSRNYTCILVLRRSPDTAPAALYGGASVYEITLSILSLRKGIKQGRSGIFCLSLAIEVTRSTHTPSLHSVHGKLSTSEEDAEAWSGVYYYDQHVIVLPRFRFEPR